MRLLIVGLLFIGCTTKHETKKPIIDGEWIFVDNPNEITINYLGLKFKDDTLYTIADRGLTQEGKYTISGDTIIVEEFGNITNKQRRIKTFTDDSLILRDGDRYYSRRLEFTDNLKFDSIKIIAGSCFGECPEFILKLSNNGQANFKPIAYCKVTQQMDFNMDKEQMDKIDSLFKWTYLHKLDTNKLSGAIDDWAFDISITYNSGQTIEIKTTRSLVPYRLKRIFGLLITDLRRRELLK